jgi:hypothetical protein
VIHRVAVIALLTGINDSISAGVRADARGSDTGIARIHNAISTTIMIHRVAIVALLVWIDDPIAARMDTDAGIGQAADIAWLNLAGGRTSVTIGDVSIVAFFTDIPNTVTAGAHANRRMSSGAIPTVFNGAQGGTPVIVIVVAVIALLKAVDDPVSATHARTMIGTIALIIDGARLPVVADGARRLDLASGVATTLECPIFHPIIALFTGVDRSISAKPGIFKLTSRAATIPIGIIAIIALLTRIEVMVTATIMGRFANSRP